MSEFAKLAQDFVEATSLLVGQRTINIMDQKGIIIASTEKHRIGDFHQGASEVLATGKPVRIKKEDLPRYPGTKEGYNMPIFLNDEIIGRWLPPQWRAAASLRVLCPHGSDP